MRSLDPTLAARLRAAGVDPEAVDDPAAAWRRLHEQEGRRATLLDRYALEAAHRAIDEEALGAADRARLAIEVLTVRDPGFSLVDGSARELRDPVEVVEYDPAWPEQFEAWRARLAGALAGLEPGIEHIGSTAVPGLAAKPVIDIAVAVPDVEDDASFVPAIEGLGVALRSRETAHRYFRPAGNRPRNVQIHVWQRESEGERGHLLFRDFLRATPAAADAYGRLKIEAALRFRDDRIAYNEAKSALILDLMAEAEHWAASVVWRMP
jgi:GrpB-like predicted nucleotidyltransferase (UPF0157 family)